MRKFSKMNFDLYEKTERSQDAVFLNALVFNSLASYRERPCAEEKAVCVVIV